jgi:hypothetical protein
MNRGAAPAVHSLPRLRGRDREGACNKIEGTSKQFTCALPNPPPQAGEGADRVSPLALIPFHTNML